jgi:hypothetical protein
MREILESTKELNVETINSNEVESALIMPSLIIMLNVNLIISPQVLLNAIESFFDFKEQILHFCIPFF